MPAAAKKVTAERVVAAAPAGAQADRNTGVTRWKVARPAKRAAAPAGQKPGEAEARRPAPADTRARPERETAHERQERGRQPAQANEPGNPPPRRQAPAAAKDPEP